MPTITKCTCHAMFISVLRYQPVPDHHADHVHLESALSPAASHQLSVGLMIGFVLPPLSTHVHYSHKGYSLYNVGFSAGIIATVVVSVLKSFGITTESRLIWSEGNNQLLFAILCGLFAAMILAAFLFGGKEVSAPTGISCPAPESVEPIISGITGARQQSSIWPSTASLPRSCSRSRGVN